MYSEHDGDRRRRRPAALRGRPPPARRRRASRTAASPATPTAASRGDFDGYANTVLVARNCLAVTGACLMTRARRLRRGRRPHAPTLPVNYNDIDYCLKLRGARAAGRLRPGPRPLPLRVLEPLDRGRGLGEGAAARALGAADRRRSLLQPEPQVRYPAAQLPLKWATPPVSAPVGPQKGNDDDLNYERLYSYRFRDIDQDGEDRRLEARSAPTSTA